MAKNTPEISVAFRVNPPVLVRWGRAKTPYGRMLFGMTKEGDVCRVAFAPGQHSLQALKNWQKEWRQTVFVEDKKAAEAMARRLFLKGNKPVVGSIKVCLSGTPFQRRVWKALIDLAPGQTASYGEMAKKIKQPKAARAVGRALGANPVPILVPCHRVVGKGGKIGGYACGLALKKRLLREENVELSF